MSAFFPERGPLNLPQIADQILAQWEAGQVFQKSIDERPVDKPFVFFEGPPSANGKPGIHHVMARSIKDIFCRYQTMKGHRVERKAGWDTHGLPVELGVEKELGITKEDIGSKISVEEYNAACRKTVMRFTEEWNDLTRRMGYWVDMESPYVTYENKYIESVWWILNRLHEKDLLYKGYTVQPYSPKAGTGLSSHELNQPGAYQDVTDTTIIAQFRALPICGERLRQHVVMPAEETIPEGLREAARELEELPVDFLAWTTTPWTLPSNTALTVGVDIDYVLVLTKNRYTSEFAVVILAEALYAKHFNGKKAPESVVVGQVNGGGLCGARYVQLIEWALPMERPEDAFRIIPGDFVTTEDGTGIVHTAPTFGVDDARVAASAHVPPMLVDDGAGHGVPLVDLQGRLRPECGPLAGRYVKQEYYEEGQAPERSVDVEIAIDLKTRGQAFLVEKYSHNYPHCWRTDKPILYYPMDSWFVKATAAKERMMELNKTIDWKPESTGTGRFGKWLENLNDWNLSRSRFWGIPIPIWRTADGSESRCIGSVEELRTACAASVEAGLMDVNPLDSFTPGDMSKANYEGFDLHKHAMDSVILQANDGRPMHRETDLIDVWFDSGSMPYAQWHYPFENRDKIDSGSDFPADFIAEGVDQTRGWFYTLHAIATMAFDSVAYKRVISNGLVLDKNGVKMSKRLGNAVDPFATIAQYGPDATRWYMITNAQPWDNLKFNEAGIVEVQRKFFGTLHNTYNFLALYAGIDGFRNDQPPIPHSERPEIDRWILSRLNTLISDVDQAYEALEPTRAGRLIQQFAIDELSNWHVRLSRRRFWKGDMSPDKISAYQTLIVCLETVARLGSPIAPFYLDRLYCDVIGTDDSVHLADFPVADSVLIDSDLEARMALAQQLSSQALSLRKRERIRVRQPLSRILVPALSDKDAQRIVAVCDLVKSEVNVKDVEILRGDVTSPQGDSEINIVKRVKPDFKALGPRFGKRMKMVAATVSGLGAVAIATLEREGRLQIEIPDDQGAAEILLTDVEVLTDDIPGWLVSSEGGVTVALDITISDELKAEGLAREVVNRVQGLRKNTGLEVTDRIELILDSGVELRGLLAGNLEYIRAETLAGSLHWAALGEAEEIDLDGEHAVRIALNKLD